MTTNNPTPSWQSNLLSDIDWLKDHFSKQGWPQASLGGQAAERVLMALSHVAAPSAAAGDVREKVKEVIGENLIRIACRNAKAAKTFDEDTSAITDAIMAAGVSALVDRVAELEGENERIGETMRMYAKYSTLHLDLAESAESQLAALQLANAEKDAEIGRLKTDLDDTFAQMEFETTDLAQRVVANRKSADAAEAKLTAYQDELGSLNSVLDMVAAEREAWKIAHDDWKRIAIKHEDRVTVLSETNARLVEAMKETSAKVHREMRAAEMSSGIMLDPKRTGNWAGAQRTADAFDRIGLRLAEIKANINAFLVAEGEEHG